MKLSQIIKLAPPDEKTGIDPFLDRDYSCITHRQEYLSTNTLFVEFPGRDHLLTSNNQVILSHQHKAERPELIYQDLAKASQSIAIALHQQHIKAMRFIAVTGTNGKSTVVDFCRQLCEQLDPELKPSSLGTLGLSMKNKQSKTANTTPFPLDLYHHVGEAYQAGSRIIFMEASSHGLDQDRLQGLSFNTAAFTNLSQDHLDYHNNLESYFEAKKKVLQQTNGSYIINLDCQTISQVQNNNLKKVTFSILDSRANYFAKDLYYHENGISGTIVRNGQDETPFELSALGEHNVSNLLCAIATLGSLGYSFKDTVKAAAYCQAPKGRLDLIQHLGQGRIIIDYAHTPDAIERALLSIRKHYPNSTLKILVGCGGNRDQTKRPLMAQAAAHHADTCIFTSDNPRFENPEGIIRDMTNGLHTQTPWIKMTDRREAIEQSVRDLKDGEVLLLAGKGHEQTQEVQGKTIPFDEVAICYGAKHD